MASPKHEKLRRSLEAEIRRKKPAPHSPFVSERDLIARTGLSQPTVRHALGALVEEGVLYRVQGKGTFIAPPARNRNLWVVSTPGTMRENRSYGLTRFLLSLWEDPRVVEGPWTVQYVPRTRLEGTHREALAGSRAPHALVIFRSMDLYRQVLGMLGDLPIPRLFFGSSAWQAELEGRSSVLMDEGTLVETVIGALVDGGRKRVALCLDTGRPVEQFRARLFSETCKTKGVTVVGALPLPGTGPGFVEALRRLRPEAIFTTTDRHGASVLAALSAETVRVPDEVSVVSVDDYPYAGYLSPPLTSVDPRDDLGARAVLDWADRIAGTRHGLKKETTLIQKPELRKRATL